MTGIVGKTGRYLVVYVCIVALGIFLMLRLPTSFLPDEDQGRIFTITLFPPGATIERSTEVAKKIEDFYWKNRSKKYDNNYLLKKYNLLSLKRQNNIISPEAKKILNQI